MAVTGTALWQNKNGGAQKGENAMFDRQTKRFCSAVVDALPSEVPEDVMQGWIDNPKALQKFLRGLISFDSDLLKFMESVAVEGADMFVVDDQALKKANVGWTSQNFNRLFKGKVEMGVSQAELNVHELKRESMDEPIIKELGGENRVKIHAATFLNFLKGRQGGWRVAYILGNDGKLWAVRARWSGIHCYWVVEARSVGRLFRWSAGDQVLSRK